MTDEPLGPGKPLALLIYLACTPRRTAPRSHLIDLLWSDLTPEKARHALRQTLWYLRQAIGPHNLLARGNDIVLTDQVAIDRDEFLHAIERGQLHEATALYEAEFLSEFAVPGGVDFEQWADIERQRLRAAFLLAAEQLVREQLLQGKMRDAVTLARRARELTRNSERAWRLLLDALHTAHDHINFSVEVDALEGMLQRDEREAEPATRALLERVHDVERQGDDRPSPGLNPALVGREAEFSAVLRAWDHVRLHGGAHVHIEAAPGLGKTRLLDEVYKRLRLKGVRAVTLRASQGDHAIAYSFASRIAEYLARLPGAVGISGGSAAALVALNPTLSNIFQAQADTAIGGEALRRRSTALVELMRSVAEEQPFALLLDDLKWADAVSLSAIGPLLDRTADTAVLVVTASRPMTGWVRPENSFPRLLLSPLSEQHLGELLASLGTMPHEPWGAELPQALALATGGSPLLLLETLQLAIERGSLRLESSAWQCPDWKALLHLLEGGSALRHRVAQLDGEGAGVLLLLSAAGSALHTNELERATGWATEVTHRVIEMLEHRGLVRRIGDGWEPVHDEIAAYSITLSSSDSRREAHAALGHMLAQSAGDSRTQLTRAAQHLAEAESWTALRSTFLHYIRRVRADGDGRRLRFVVGDFLEGVPRAVTERLLRELGRWNRLRYDVARPVAIVAGLVVLVGSGLALRASRGSQADAILYIEAHRSSGMDSLLTVPLRASSWESGTHIELAKTFQLPMPHPATGSRAILSRPDGKEWALTVDVDRANTTDIMLADERGVRPLVTGLRDDNAMSWLPDGSGLLITTARYSEVGADDYDIAIATLDGGFRKLTQSRDNDLGPVPSPDGTRIAFTRKAVSGARQVCLMPFDAATEPACEDTDLGQGVEVAGWREAEQLLIKSRDLDGLYRLLAVDLRTGARTTVLTNLLTLVPSPDGEWLAYEALPPGRVTTAWFVARWELTDQPRELILPDSVRAVNVAWRLARTPRRYLDRLVLQDHPATLASHAAFRLQATSFDAEGRPLDHELQLRWGSLDTLVASVDSTGLVRPHRQGQVRIWVTAGGWRSDTTLLTFRADVAQEVLVESWDSGIDRHWVTFGTPQPEIVAAGAGKLAFWNHGDGSYISGAYSRNSWSAVRGFGVEAEFSAPIFRTQWQQLIVQLIGGFDSLTLRGADYATGVLPTNLFNGRSCSIGLPGGEGKELAGQIGMGSGVSSSQAVDPLVLTGRWGRLRIQIFPDGTCGVALNGVPIWRSRIAMSLEQPFAIFLGNASVDTRILHGTIRAWTGIRDDLPWGELR